MRRQAGLGKFIFNIFFFQDAVLQCILNENATHKTETIDNAELTFSFCLAYIIFALLFSFCVFYLFLI